MSAWHLVTRELASSKVSLRAVDFVSLGLETSADSYTTAIQRAKGLGMMTHYRHQKGRSWSTRWVITDRGLEWFRGKFTLPPLATAALADALWRVYEFERRDASARDAELSGCRETRAAGSVV